jgi:hypothetical protein
MAVQYEWDIETWSVGEDGENEVLDHDHRDKLSEFGIEELIRAINQDVEPGDTYTRLVLVRDDDNGRSWAYVTDDGNLPEQFCDAYDRPVAKVPQRFIAEFNR